MRRRSTLTLRSRFTERDYEILDCLHEHRCLTTHHISDLFFNSGTSARRRMLELTQMGLVERFRRDARHGQGTHPFHYVLGAMGAQVVAAQRGVEVKELGYRKGFETKIAHSSRLAHLVAVNTFFSRLSGASRELDGVALTQWHSEAATIRKWGSLVFPDGSGELRFPSGKLSFFLEMDRGTEKPRVLAEKLPKYSDLAEFDNSPEFLLFCFTQIEREVGARKVFYGCLMPIATATLDAHVDDPLGANWLLMGSQRRRPLSDLKEEIGV